MKIEVNKSYLNNNGQRVDICGSFVRNNKKLFLGITTNHMEDEQYGQTFDEDGNWVDGDDVAAWVAPQIIEGFKIVSKYRELFRQEFFVHTSPGNNDFDSIEKFTLKSNTWTKRDTLEEIKEEASDNIKGARFYKITVEEQP